MRHHYVVPYGPYLAKDGKYVNLSVATQQDWDIFCAQVVERDDLLTDQRYTWRGSLNWVRMDPHVQPAHVFSVEIPR